MLVHDDIEKADATNVKDVSTLDTSFNTSGNMSGNNPDSTSKSVRIKMAANPLVLQYVSGMNDDAENADEVYVDPVFGKCCDLRKVCLIIDMIYCFQKISVFVTVLLGLSVVDPDHLGLREYDDDLYQIEVRRMDTLSYILMAKELSGVPFAVIGFIGAYKFYKYPVLTTAIWTCIDLVWSVACSRWLSSAYVAFYIYPHFALFCALKKGRITSENYVDVQHCCCDKKELT